LIVFQANIPFSVDRIGGQKKQLIVKPKYRVFLMCVCDIFYAFFYVTVYSKMSEFGDMLKDLSEEKLNLCKDIRRVVKTFLRHSSDIREKT
jgi:hypothetical protein